MDLFEVLRLKQQNVATTNKFEDSRVCVATEKNSDCITKLL